MHQTRIRSKLFGIRAVFLIFCLIASYFIPSAFANTCVPVIGSPIDVNGIIVGAGPVSPGGCTIAPGWAGSVGQGFVVYPIGEPMPSRIPKLFLTGYRTGESSKLDTIYVGMHVEEDPELTPEDRLVLYFDANGNNVWDNGDFALFYEMVPTTGSGPTTIASGETCQQTTGTALLYLYNESADPHWQVKGAIPAAIASSLSWDYDSNPQTSDSESGIWELELGINVEKMGLKAPVNGPGFKLGAKLYVYQKGIESTTMWHWPAADLTPNGDYSGLFDPNEGGVTPDKLAQTSIGSCGFDVAFDPDGSTGVTETSNKGESNKFTRLDVNNANDFDQNGYATKKNHFSGRIKLFNPADPSDSSPLALPNNGNVNFYLRPYNAGFLGGPKGYLMKSAPVSFTQLSQAPVIQFDWPQTKTDYAPAQSDLHDSEHVCLHVEIDGFAADSDKTNNEVNRNLVYTPLSTVHDSFVISSGKGEVSHVASSAEYIIRAAWKNVPPSEISTVNAVGAAPRVPNKWSYQFTNAQQLGIKDLGKGYYSMLLKPGETKRVEIDISGGTMPVKTTQLKLSSRAGGQALAQKRSGDVPLELNVDPGNIVTIISHGLITLDPKRKKSNGPNGYSESEYRKQDFLLASDYYNSWENIGAVVASFDRKRWFVMGTDKTFLVPEGVKKLFLAVNDFAGAYDDNVGEFELNVAISGPIHLPTRLVSQANPKNGLPAQMQAGSNLPELDIEVFNAVPVKKGSQEKILKPTGYVSYAVYASHREEIAPPTPRPVCGVVKPSNAGFSSLMLMVGVAFLGRSIGRKRKKEEEGEE